MLKEKWELEDGDLTATVHCAFVLETSLKEFLIIRNYLRGLPEARLVFGSMSNKKFYVVKDEDWRIVQYLKGTSEWRKLREVVDHEQATRRIERTT